MLLIPLGPENREVRRWPWVTIFVVALNVLVFAAAGPAGRKCEHGRTLAAEWGFVPDRPGLGSVVTASFLHTDGWHLAANMAALLATGPFLEDACGRVLYVAVYLASDAVGAFVDGQVSAEGGVPRVGASAAVYGVEGAFLIRFGGTILRFFLAPFGFLPFLGLRVRLRAAVVLLFGFLEQMVFAADGGGDVAHGAHVGGFAFGLLAAAAIWATGLERRWVDPAIEAQVGWRQHPLVVRAGEARFAGNLAEARRDVRQALEKDPGNADGWALAARLALDLSDGPEAVRCAGRAVTLYLRKGETDPAADVALEVLRKARPCLTPGFGGMVGALMERRGQVVDAISIYEEVAERFPGDDAGRRAAMRLPALRQRRVE